ncbi:CaiB/BaiF CoA transferase family protein [Magnetospirillum gryphiswaldense]|uniref:CoA-transferase family III protein n=1 Tax=Magnetospirillum gryphiswaldense TaxID=55518 RepID=A4TWB3_9PROT|nr:CaiB/BaiF CoA-transferase family protein [Magnetospirillum gryphiswaldense]AVM74044.1 Succinyl-CoA:(R)-benzylsuccinate CoA-transferase subunit BbsF [Magnetospirillum gryphiswaldense MSR-1]AVM77947.1 Succinyl-CoA:(R)-benzylsuccinate CoA-transferase subunit BbsF [Magnetospirillum gryphiswaldense]CAM74920.1 CoA-transferase family III protein [Magnetospirillum gryphiswaldense MSR-1]
MTKGALAHLRVLDLSRVLAGPWAGQMLADLGAEVIKVEKPGQGDDTRAWGPPFLKDAHGRDTRESAYYLSANRGKQSLAIDFTQAEGQQLVRQLAADCDVVLENFKAGGLAKYGLDYASLRQVKPDIIYCSITGFGQDGPYAQRAGYDFLVQGMGGLMSLTGEPEGEPMKVGVALTDIFTGMYASVAVLAALSHRDRTGQGQHVDLALLDVQVAVLANQAANYLVGGMVPKRLGNAHPNIVPYQAFATSDGHVILAVGNDGQFQKFCAVAGCPEVAADTRYASNAGRVGNRDTLIPLLREVLRSRPSAVWIETLEAAGVPCGPINTLDQVFDNPQIKHRGMVAAVDHPLAGSVDLVANPIRFSETPVAYDRAPPVLGADTDVLLSRLLGLDAAAIADLRAKGVVGG